MMKQLILVLALVTALGACASEQPRVIQATSDMPEVRLTSGMATQIDLPSSGRVQSGTVGNPTLVAAERVDNVVNLIPQEGSGETNLIVRSIDDDGRAKIYQYRVVVPSR